MTGSAPKPGQPVRGSTTGRPIMALFDLMGRRWVLRIVWELSHASSPMTFRALRERCDEVSSSVLTRRLAELTQAGLTHHTGDGYALTGTGDRLVRSLQPLITWSREWAAELDDPEVK